MERDPGHQADAGRPCDSGGTCTPNAGCFPVSVLKVGQRKAGVEGKEGDHDIWGRDGQTADGTAACTPRRTAQQPGRRGKGLVHSDLAVRSHRRIKGGPSHSLSAAR